MYKRTDMADECISEYQEYDNVHRNKRGKIFDITEIIIDDDSFFESMGKHKGK